MVHIDIPEATIDYFRSLDREEQGIFWLQDSEIISYRQLANLSENPDDAIGFFAEDADGIIHNHLYDSPFSVDDKDYMLPEYVYVLITPNEIFAMQNGELIKCN